MCSSSRLSCNIILFGKIPVPTIELPDVLMLRQISPELVFIPDF